MKYYENKLNELREEYDKLQAENAELRKQLEKENHIAETYLNGRELFKEEVEELRKQLAVAKRTYNSLRTLLCDGNSCNNCKYNGRNNGLIDVGCGLDFNFGYIKQQAAAELEQGGDTC